MNRILIPCRRATWREFRHLSFFTRSAGDKMTKRDFTAGVNESNLLQTWVLRGYPFRIMPWIKKRGKFAPYDRRGSRTQETYGLTNGVGFVAKAFTFLTPLGCSKMAVIGLVNAINNLRPLLASMWSLCYTVPPPPRNDADTCFGTSFPG